LFSGIAGMTLQAPATDAHAALLDERRRLRRAARAARASLLPARRRQAQQSVLRHLLRGLCIKPGMRVAAYLAGPGEFDPAPLLAALHRRGVRLLVPRLSRVHPAGMGFAPLAAPLHRNRYGLLQPAAPPSCSLQTVDVVLVPLVAFDATGARLGMGGGFYDRALAFRRRRQHWRGPLLIGVAFAEQRVQRIPVLPWDVHLDAVLTDNGWIWPAENAS
jgi:5-formyltetrahydrofolate cyclo-ligase